MPERDRKDTRSNMTVVTTKSGTKVYVAGNRGDRQIRDRAGDQFVNIYNRNFTEKEQRKVGNIYYDLNNRDHSLITNPPPGHNVVAATGTFVGDEVHKFNPHRKKMVDMFIGSKERNSEATVTHELIHAKIFMAAKKGCKHNERRIDFETVGRVSKHGLNTMTNGYYFSPLGNHSLGHKRGWSNQKKGQVAQQGLFSDRLLLTGSMSKSITGKTAEQRSVSLFPKSFFFKKF